MFVSSLAGAGPTTRKSDCVAPSPARDATTGTARRVPRCDRPRQGDIAGLSDELEQVADQRSAAMQPKREVTIPGPPTYGHQQTDAIAVQEPHSLEVEDDFAARVVDGVDDRVANRFDGRDVQGCGQPQHDPTLGRNFPDQRGLSGCPATIGSWTGRSYVVVAEHDRKDLAVGDASDVAAGRGDRCDFEAVDPGARKVGQHLYLVAHPNTDTGGAVHFRSPSLPPGKRVWIRDATNRRRKPILNGFLTANPTTGRPVSGPASSGAESADAAPAMSKRAIAQYQPGPQQIGRHVRRETRSSSPTQGAIGVGAAGRRPLSTAVLPPVG